MALSLQKNEKLSLVKESSNLHQITVGLGWDAKKATGGFLKKILSSDEIDLDASCVLLDAQGNEVDHVWWRKLKSRCGAVIHNGDNRTGEGDGDDESIIVNLSNLPQNIEYVAFTVHSFSGQTFNDVENCFCRVMDQSGKELVRYDLKEQGSHEGIYIALITRNNGQWEFTAKGGSVPGNVLKDAIPTIKNSL